MKLYSGPCWIDNKHKLERTGYVPKWKGGGVVIRAHRLSYEYFIGPIGSGKQIDHLCRNRACYNPRHLEAVTQKENTLRGNTIASRNAKKTHCHKGHPLIASNLRAGPLKMGKRECLACRKVRRKHARRKAAGQVPSPKNRGR